MRALIVTTAVAAVLVAVGTLAATHASVPAPAASAPYGALQAPGLNVIPVWSSAGSTWPQARYDQIKAKGFGVVRFILHWDRMEPTQGALDQTNLTTLDTAIARAKAAGLSVVLVPIMDYGSDGMNFYPGWAKTGGDSVTVVNAHAAGYLAKLGARYAPEPAVAAIEPVSEPYRWPIDQNAVLSMYDQAFKALRGAGFKRALIYEPTYGDSDMTGANGALITDRTNVVFSLHDYYAGGYGAGYEANKTRSGPGTYAAGTAYDPAKWADLEAHLQVTLDWLWNQNVPLWVGEYGDHIGNPAHDQYLTDLTGRYKKFASIALGSGVPSLLGWDFWEFFEASGANSATLGSDPASWQPFAGLLTYPYPDASSTPTPTATPTPTPTPTPVAGAPCGTGLAPLAWDHVAWIVFENKRFDQIVGSSNAPYINSIAKQCALATNFTAEAHPSLPNYIAMTSGSTQGITDDSGPSSHPLGVASIFSQLGTRWRSLEESMPSPCYLSNSGQYAVRHNPAAYYTNIRTACASQDVALGSTPDLSAAFTFITPNLCHDMHSSTCASSTAEQISLGDQWLSGFLPKLLATPEYAAGRTAVVITWDEDDYSSNQHIATLVVAPSVAPGKQVSTTYNHYSMLRATEEMLGLGPLGNAASATSMRSGFGL